MVALIYDKALLHSQINFQLFKNLRCYQCYLLQVIYLLKIAMLRPVLHNGVGQVPADIRMLLQRIGVCCINIYLPDRRTIASQ